MEKMSVAQYLATNPRQDRHSKYGNLKTEYNGYVYMSKKEADYAQELDYNRKERRIGKRVVSFTRQVPFQITVNGKKICKYLADFKVLYADGHEEIIDVKGVRTQMYSLKKKLVEAQYGITIIEK